LRRLNGFECGFYRADFAQGLFGPALVLPELLVVHRGLEFGETRLEFLYVKETPLFFVPFL
jgi:hypothetical protein